MSISLQDAAIKLLKDSIKVKKGEHLALITDSSRNRIFLALVKAAINLDVEYSVFHINPNRTPYEPLGIAKDALADVDIIIATTKVSATHSPETDAAMKHGARFVSMPGVTETMFTRAMGVDLLSLRAVHRKLLRVLRKADKIHVTSPSSTDLSIDFKGKKFEFEEDDGDNSEKGDYNNVPFGEVYAYIDVGDGCIAIDSWGKELTRSDGAKIWVKNGKIIAWNKAGGKYVERQMKSGSCGMLIAELGIGTNLNIKRPIGFVMNDEKIGGSVHIAFGAAEGIRKCPTHDDFVILKPTLTADGKTLIKNGKFV